MSEVASHIEDDVFDPPFEELDHLPAWKCASLIAAISLLLWFGIYFAVVRVLD
ncbi:hypothetical protein [Roseomonas sp. KE2513]|uniref:hypothetical protein n=1 Tax=Roseomonas sp. KE2513 TaxID=2479202 RepID=UPI0018DFCAF0|nr:hypothetical protein [Roseomonas sp. KE2513]